MTLKQNFLQEPSDVTLEFIKAWNERDPDRLASLFTEDAEFVNVVGLWWHNRQDIWKAHDYGLKLIFNNSKLELRKSILKMVGDKVAVVHARMKLSGQTAAYGIDKPLSRQNIFSFVMHRTSKGWVCVSAHNTDIVPGKETNLVDESRKMSAVDYRKE
ncbi:MAG: SgcJ/EcaC family oxidoreductase [Bacteroidota bacterium]